MIYLWQFRHVFGVKEGFYLQISLWIFIIIAQKTSLGVIMRFNTCSRNKMSTVICILVVPNLN
jgi:hypothetical protein